MQSILVINNQSVSNIDHQTNDNTNNAYRCNRAKLCLWRKYIKCHDDANRFL